MTPEEHIEKIAGREPGFTLPEGYFEQLFASMPEALPEREVSAPHKMTTWQRVKPYVYLAAMFAGIWCMMKMFHTMSSTEISLDNPPSAIVASLDNPQESIEEMMPDFAGSDLELESVVSQEYDSFDQLSKDLDLTLEPQYESMNVASHVKSVTDGTGSHSAIKARAVFKTLNI